MKRHVKHQVRRHQVSAFWLLLGKSLRFQSGTPKSGFTLIESLVAIIVVSVTVVAISPPIFWATGTRVQNRRAEQALLIAQSSIDEVRGRIERGGATTAELPAVAPSAAGGLRPYPATGPAPTAAWDKNKSVVSNADNPRCNTVSTLKPAIAATDTTAAVPADQHYPAVGQYMLVDTGAEPKEAPNECTPEFLVQIFRNDGICSDGPCASSTLPPAQRRPIAFSVGVRVYSALAARSSVANLSPEKARLGGTTGTGQAGVRPLAVLYATVAKSDSSTALNRYRELCKAGAGGAEVCE